MDRLFLILVFRLGGTSLKPMDGERAFACPQHLWMALMRAERPDEREMCSFSFVSSDVGVQELGTKTTKDQEVPIPLFSPPRVATPHKMTRRG